MALRAHVVTARDALIASRLSLEAGLSQVASTVVPANRERLGPVGHGRVHMGLVEQG